MVELTVSVYIIRTITNCTVKQHIMNMFLSHNPPLHTREKCLFTIFSALMANYPKCFYAFIKCLSTVVSNVLMHQITWQITPFPGCLPPSPLTGTFGLPNPLFRYEQLVS